MEGIHSLFNKPMTNWQKVFVCLIMAVYFVSPVDVVPDFITGLGQIDDIVVVALGLIRILSAKKALQ